MLPAGANVRTWLRESKSPMHPPTVGGQLGLNSSALVGGWVLSKEEGSEDGAANGLEGDGEGVPNVVGKNVEGAGTGEGDGDGVSNGGNVTPFLLDFMDFIAPDFEPPLLLIPFGPALELPLPLPLPIPLPLPFPLTFFDNGIGLGDADRL